MFKVLIAGVLLLSLLIPASASAEKLPPKAKSQIELAGEAIETGWGPGGLSTNVPTRCPRAKGHWACSIRTTRGGGLGTCITPVAIKRRAYAIDVASLETCGLSPR